MAIDPEEDATATQSPEERLEALTLSVATDEKPHIPGYELEELRGRGTFGEVWSGRQLSSGQKVAVKILRARPGASWAYFRSEVERHSLVAEHPNIVTLLDADLEADPPYFVMNLYPGSLADHAHSNPERVVSWLEQIARALRHTHQRGLLHCDLKPSNVLVDVEGQAQLADFGQAVLRSEESRSLGSLGFMAPEQANPSALPDVRWDVYALGATGYFLLSGERPRLTVERLRSNSAGELLNDYQGHLALQPLQPLHVDRDLEEILTSCLQLEASHRPDGMAEVLEDLERRRQRRPLLCRRPWSRRYLLSRFLQRNALTTGFATLLLLVLLVGLTLFYRQYAATRARLAGQFYSQGWSLFQGGETAAAYLWWTEALRLAPREPVYRKPIRDYPFPLQRIWEHRGELHCIRFSSDGKRLLAGASDGSASVWDVASGAREASIAAVPQPAGEGVRPLDIERVLQAADFAPDNVHFVTSAPVRIWDSNGLVAECGPGEQVAWSPDGKTILAQVHDGVRVLDARSGRPLYAPLQHPDVQGARFSPDGRHVLSFGGQQAKLWNVATGSPECSLPAPSNVYFADFDDVGRRIVVPTSDGSVFVWSLNGKRLLRFKTPEVFGCVASFSHDGKRLLVGCTMGYLGMFDSHDGHPLTPLKRSRWTPLGARFCSGDHRFLTYSYYGLARLWDVETGDPRSPSFVNDGPLTSVALSPDGKYLATASGRGTVRLFRLEASEPQCVQEITLDTPRGDLVVFSPEGRMLLTGVARSGVCRSWDPVTGRTLLPAFQSGPKQVNLRANFSANGRYLALGGHEPQVYEVSSGKAIGKSLPRSPTGYFTAAVSGDGKRMATLEWDRHIRFWNVMTGEVEREFRPGVLAVSCAFSPDDRQFYWGSMDDTVRRVAVPAGETQELLQTGMFVGTLEVGRDVLLTGSGDGNARLWNAERAEPLSRPMPHGAALLDVALSPNGDRIATVSLDDKARLWSRLGEPLLPSLPHPGVAAVSFTPDGRQLMTASSTRIRFWDARLETEESPEHVRLRVEVQTGMQLAGNRGDLGSPALTLAPLSAKEWEARRRELLGGPESGLVPLR